MVTGAGTGTESGTEPGMVTGTGTGTGGHLLGRLLALVGWSGGPPGPGAERAPYGPPAPPSPDDPRQALRAAVAAKLLEGWLANRRQTLVPHALNLPALPPGQAALLAEVMAAAALAGGPAEAEEARRLALLLGRLGAGEAEARALGAALREPRPLPALLGAVQEAGLGAHAYAAALLAADRRGRAGRAFLDYLAARLGLAPEAARSLERRYRA